MERIQWVDVAKGFGIILVVIGHFDPKIGSAILLQIHDLIYGFHMPLFFILSGYHYRPGNGGFLPFIANKWRRLGVPFISVAGVFLLAKALAGLFVGLDHPIDSRTIAMLAWNPVQSFVPLLWYVHALLIMIVLCYFFLRSVRSVVLLYVVSVVLWWFAYAVDLGGVSRSLEYLQYFVAGIALQQLDMNLGNSYRIGLVSIASLMTYFVVFVYGCGRIRGVELAYSGSIAAIFFSLLIAKLMGDGVHLLRKLAPVR